MSSELATAPVTPGFHKATSQLSATLGVEPRMMVESLKKQCFPSMRPEDISDAQLAAFVSVANTLELNPLIPGMLYAYPAKNGGIVPVSGPDGVLKKLDEQIAAGKLDGYKCVLFPDDVTLPPTHAVAKIWRKGSDRPAMFTAIFKEWVVGSNPNWGSRPRHMLWLRAIKQCARQVIHGVPFDEDDIKIGDMVNVTPVPATTDDPPPTRKDPPARSKKGAAAVAENPAPAAAPLEVVATPVVEKVPEKIAEKAPEKKAEPAPEPKPDPVAKAADTPKERAFLEPDERIETTCAVIEVTPLLATVAGVSTPTVQATVRGGYNGTIYHFGGATQSGEAIVPNPEWKAGNTLKVTLFGKKNKKTNRVMPSVEKVEETSAATSVDVE